ncbi:MAG: Asp-tRNA(Asn)/Glu-tRNA(Gln) amidotransferase subunit GatA [Deltaproteobacteria bacterium]|jgi:aspartyl-tRNA(Asn)/glutamyl-tRNA(Gln) amidotransferase subunit A|nr:Asp-tRNA(Asn)/Glu-tRNA(Gln) amidotransferase subunit GatA [Deltaproteobacteria bacterium]
MSELWRLGLGQAYQGLLAKDFTAEELVLDCLDRIKATEPAINACLTVLDEQAIQQAKELDRLGPDPQRPLWGVPLTVKDVFSLKGAPTTAGSKILENYLCSYEATVVQRLRQAGAVICAKTNCDEFAMGSSTEFSAYGPTSNPWNTQRVPGGSSGGAAASVAACQTPGGFGTDTGGSIRQPAALCGCVGLKPTYGRVSRYGIIAYGSSLDQAGPFARSVKDCARLLASVAGPDGLDSTASTIPVDDYLNPAELDVKQLTLGLPKELWSASFSPEVETVLQEAKTLLTKAGVNLKEVSLPSLKYSVASYYILASAEASTNLARYDGVRYGYRAPDRSGLAELYLSSRSHGFGPEVQRRILLGTFVLSSGYYDAYFRKAAQVRRLIQQQYDAALESCQFLLAPVSSIPAWPFGSFTNDPLTIYQLDMMTLPLNLAGAPGLSLPCGLGADGLPVGIQIMGRAFDESALLKAGSLIEQVFPPIGTPEVKAKE